VRSGLFTTLNFFLQDPPPEEYDQMLAFYYKWQEKDKVCFYSAPPCSMADGWHQTDAVFLYVPDGRSFKICCLLNPPLLFSW
jgi:hypothetical protein